MSKSCLPNSGDCHNNPYTFLENMGISRTFEAIYAYSDSIYDLPLLKFSDNPTAVNPDRKLRNEAEKNSWIIVDSRSN